MLCCKRSGFVAETAKFMTSWLSVFWTCLYSKTCTPWRVVRLAPLATQPGGDGFGAGGEAVLVEKSFEVRSDGPWRNTQAIGDRLVS
jgi:hypothetical protein